jgi:hypothetical protein
LPTLLVLGMAEPVVLRLTAKDLAPRIPVGKLVPI